MFGSGQNSPTSKISGEAIPESILSQKPRTKTTGQLRRFAIKILSLDTSNEITRKKRKRAVWDENYLLNCLAAIIEEAVALLGPPGGLEPPEPKIRQLAGGDFRLRSIGDNRSTNSVEPLSPMALHDAQASASYGCSVLARRATLLCHSCVSHRTLATTQPFYFLQMRQHPFQMLRISLTTLFSKQKLSL